MAKQWLSQAQEVELATEKEVLAVATWVTQVKMVDTQEARTPVEQELKAATDPNIKAETAIAEVNKLQVEMPWTDQEVELDTSAAKVATPAAVAARPALVGSGGAGVARAGCRAITDASALSAYLGEELPHDLHLLTRKPPRHAGELVAASENRPASAQCSHKVEACCALFRVICHSRQRW